MAKLILNGSTSGSVTLESPAVSSTTTLTLPTTSGTVVVTSGAQTIEFADGSASTPSITNSGDTNTGMFFPAADTIAFAEGGTEIVRINSNGLILFNTTSSLTDSAQFQTVVSTGKFARGTKVTTNGDYAEVMYNAASGSVGNIQINSSSVAFNTSSDYRLKENIAPMTGALDKVSQLKPVTYKWKIDGSSGQGFIAHELQAIVPDCVTGEKDAVETYTDEEGNEQTRIKPQGIDTSFLVATLTAAIQEQQTIINDLKARIETLEAK
jgi:hypothetical protein